MLLQKCQQLHTNNQGCTQWGTRWTSPPQVKPDGPNIIKSVFSTEKFQTNITQIWVVDGRFVHRKTQSTHIKDTSCYIVTSSIIGWAPIQNDPCGLLSVVGFWNSGRSVTLVTGGTHYVKVMDRLLGIEPPFSWHWEKNFDFRPPFSRCLRKISILDPLFQIFKEKSQF